VKRNLRAKAAMAMAAALCTLTVAACGGSDDGDAAASGGGDGAPETTELTVGVQAFAEVGALYVAVEEGLFEDEGLTVTPEVGTGGGAGLVAGLVSGDLDIVYTNYVSVVQAASEGLPLKMVRENDRPGAQGLFSLPSSGITKPADLEGKRVAINGLGNIMELTTRAALEENDVDPDSVQFVELPPPDMLAALSAGNVDAVWLAEPFVTIAGNTMDAVNVLDVLSGSTEDLPIAGWGTSAQFAQENPNTLAAFTRAMDAAIQMVDEDPSLIAEIVPTYTQLTPEVAAQLTPINFAVESRLDDIAQVEELMRKYGFIEDEVEVGELIAAQGD
jgi:NitT/TauT family transport system substrate-binding protein